jgi:predicted NBD/HSP70 family sugar kinase
MIKVLVIDIGGSNVKFCVPGRAEKLSFPSGNTLTPAQMTERVLGMTAGWKYHVVSIGFPGSVIRGKPAGEPPNLGKGWVKFDFEGRFKKPVKIINDAAMQALGSYRGGRMLFVGLGSGLGSTLILDNVIVPLELGELTYGNKKKLGDILGKKALEKNGLSKWKRAVRQIIPELTAAFRTDYLVLGGGSAKLLPKMPPGAKRGSNDLAFVGGERLWNRGTHHVKHTWVLA